MILQKELDNFSSEMYLDILIKFNTSEHIGDSLNCFKEDEDIRSLSEDSLKNLLEKSLSIDLEKLEKMLKKSLERGDLVKLCHFGIDIANSCSDKTNNKRKVVSVMSVEDSNPKKKLKEPTPTCDGDPVVFVNVDNEEINSRIKELDNLIQSTQYSKQKSVLQENLISFLHNLTPKKCLDNAVPEDIRRFLVYKDKSGKTQVHVNKCSNRGNKGKFSCLCPFRRAAGSVDSLIGQIRAIFRDYGRGTDWNASLGIGNPAAAPIIKKHLEAVKLEQSLAAITPKHAVPLFVDKLVKVIRLIDYHLYNQKLSVFQKYIYFRDKAFFNLLSFTGDRAGDLGLVLTDQVKCLPNCEGIILTLTKGKTIDLKDPRVIVVFKSINKECCPVKALIEYSVFCKLNNLILNNGHFFRPVNHSNTALSDNPFSSSAANSRLQLYLKDLNLFDGETPHSSRSGCALTLMWLGIDADGIKSHVGWKSDDMLRHYTVSNEVNQTSVSSKALSQINEEKAGNLIDSFKRYNDFKQLKNLFE